MAFCTNAIHLIRQNYMNCMVPAKRRRSPVANHPRLEQRKTFSLNLLIILGLYS